MSMYNVIIGFFVLSFFFVLVLAKREHGGMRAFLYWCVSLILVSFNFVTIKVLEDGGAGKPLIDTFVTIFKVTGGLSTFAFFMVVYVGIVNAIASYRGSS